MTADLACPREQDVIDAVTSRRWPERCERELREHVDSCVVCSDLALVAGALLDPDATAFDGPDLPPAGLVWWRAQLRAREEAARSAIRPIRAAQLGALAFVVLVAVLVLAAVAPSAGSWVTTATTRLLSALPQVDARTAAETALASFASRGVQLAAGAWLVLAPVAVYLAVTRD